MTQVIKFTESQQAAIDFLNYHGGSVLVTAVPDKTEKTHWGDIVPGIAIYRKLETMGVLIIIKEEPMEDGFVFTDSIELDDKFRNKFRK